MNEKGIPSPSELNTRTSAEWNKIAKDYGLNLDEMRPAAVKAIAGKVGETHGEAGTVPTQPVEEPVSAQSILEKTRQLFHLPGLKKPESPKVSYGDYLKNDEPPLETDFMNRMLDNKIKEIAQSAAKPAGWDNKHHNE